MRFLSPSHLSRALSLWFLLKGNENVGIGTGSARAAPTQLWGVEEALGPQQGLVLNGSLWQEGEGCGEGQAVGTSCLSEGVPVLFRHFISFVSFVTTVL